ncbi:hypothetical protein TrRE_jg13213 [Triparma retinervis]|uniref:Uncharacterized protein n=1 Tax=Triparma retinervis TaxID=2557542 RepID=A0A9W7FD32_9STRA|nr:hypothetical protein TrRE_jg13213 [Triparma retinervis]
MSFHSDEGVGLDGNGLDGFKELLQDPTLMGGFGDLTKSSGLGEEMALSGWRVGAFCIIAVAFNLTVYKRPQMKLLAEGSCRGVICFQKHAAAAFRHESVEQTSAARTILDLALKEQKHVENIKTRQYVEIE